MLSFFDKILKEIIVKNLGYAHEHLGVNARTIVYFVNMVRGTGKLPGQPDVGAPLLFHLRFDEFADMYFPDFVHTKSVEFIPCLNVRVSTPYQSNKLFHAVSLRHLITLLDWFMSSQRGRCGNLTFKDSHKRYLIYFGLVFYNISFNV